MSVDAKEPSSEEVKVEDELNASDDSEVKIASQEKTKGTKISTKRLSLIHI